MLPNGPNGISAFDTLDEPLVSTFSDTATALRPSYNYTLDLQGMSSNVSCKYDTTSPINVIDIREGLIQYSGTCPPGQDFLPSPVFVSQSSPHSLGFWACRTAPSANSYYLYFRGYNTSAHTIGMITCIVSPIQPTVFPLTYTGQTDTFHAQPPISSSPVSSTKLGDQMIGSIGSIVWETQSSVSNAFAEAITTLGVKSFSLPSNIQAEGYMQLYEAMIQGILDYEVRWICSSYSSLILQLGHIHPLIILRSRWQRADAIRLVLPSSHWLRRQWYIRLEQHESNSCLLTSNHPRQSDYLGHPRHRYVHR